MAKKLNKLYISLDVRGPDTIGSALRKTFAFPVTQTTVGTVSGDKYGNFLRDYAPVSAGVSASTKPNNAVTAFFQPGATPGADFANSQGAPFVAIDFIAATGNATNAASIDPVTTRHFRVRAIINRLVAVGAFPRLTANGTIYVQRQHTIEV